MCAKPLFSEHWTCRQTDVLIKADSLKAIEVVKCSILRNRSALERYLARNPFFELSLEPVEIEEDAPRVVRLMAEAASLVGVGPMAAVAGALAQLAVEEAVAAGAKNVLVDNGGDVFIHGDQSYVVAIHAGTSPLSNKLALEIPPEKLPIAVCTSSATVGPSLSFGEADAATVLASSGALADAAATAVCNQTRGKPELAVRAGLERARKIPGVKAALVIYGAYLGNWGDLPRMVIAKELSEELIKRIQIR